MNQIQQQQQQQQHPLVGSNGTTTLPVVVDTRRPSGRPKHNSYTDLMKPGESWEDLPDAAERRRIQNRLAQRAYREYIPYSWFANSIANAVYKAETCATAPKRSSSSKVKSKIFKKLSTATAPPPTTATAAASAPARVPATRTTVPREPRRKSVLAVSLLDPAKLRAHISHPRTRRC